MVKKILLLLVICCCAAGRGLEAYALGPGDLLSQYAVLMDGDTGQVLFDKGMNERAYPASTTKIMTGILAVENSYPSDLLTAGREALQLSEPNSSTIDLVEGEEFTVDSALYALMLPSANDVANVLAGEIGGDLESFARMMTDKAHMLGAVNTNFTNAHGLPEEEHYTTAYDMALVTRYAMGDPRFLRYFGADAFIMPATNKRSVPRSFFNYQSMLVPGSRFYNSDVIGGKVGYTTEARHTMSTAARRNGRTLIAVVLGSPTKDSKFTDTQKLLDHGFDDFKAVTMDPAKVIPFSAPITEEGGGSEIGMTHFLAGPSGTFLLPFEADPAEIVAQPEARESYERGDRIAATASYYLPETANRERFFLGKIPLTAKAEIYGAVTASLHLEEVEKDPSSFLGVDYGRIPLLLAVLSAGILAVAWSVKLHRVRKKRRARIRRMKSRMGATAERVR